MLVLPNKEGALLVMSYSGPPNKYCPENIITQ